MKSQTVTKDALPKGFDVVEGERYRIIVRPKIVAVRIGGVLFDTHKNFLLPACIPHLKQLSRLYKDRADNKLLIVGHTDTSGEPEYNDELSLERAQSIEAFLKRDDAAWLARYESSVPEKKRWGSAEDTMMINTLPAGDSDEEEPVRRFQDSRKLTVDGIAGPQTRGTLIKEYMALTGETKLPDTISTKVHGCGEHFPLAESGTELDAAPVDGQHEALDRRVELFFFDGDIAPAPPGDNSTAESTEYKQWRTESKLEFEAALGPSPALRVRFEFNGEPAKNERYELRINGHVLAVSTTTAEGIVDQVVPSGAELAEVRFLDKPIVRTLALKPTAEFPTVETPEGVQLRLNQLGFFAGPVDGVIAEVSQMALASFKRSKGLANDSVLDAATREALKKAYGS